MKTLPAPSPLADRWGLDPEVVFLNHGSFGACPLEVLAAQSALRVRLEREPVRFFVEELDGLMDNARKALAAFCRCEARDIVPVPNATTGVATVLSNVPLQPGDEILINDHEYPACVNNVRRAASRAGASVVTATLPFPVADPAEVVEAILSKVTARTRLCMVSHITSPSGLILPVEQIVPELERRGVVTLVDGAHVPGQAPRLDLGALGASYFTANCHKWLCAAKGAAMLWVREDRQRGFRPLVLSNHAERPKPGRPQLHTEFDYVGTNDSSAWLTVPDAIAAVGGMGGGWESVIRHNHSLAVRGRDLVCRAVRTEPPAPESMLGSLASVLLPAMPQEMTGRPTRYHDALQDALLERHRIQVPVWTAGEKRILRLSAQLYNSTEQYGYLAAALGEELRREGAM